MKINSYSFGQIVVNEKTYTEDIIIFPNKITSWWRKDSHQVKPEEIKEIIKEKPDLLIIGTGAYGVMKIKEETKEILRQNNIEFILVPTSEACKIFNETKSKKVIAALHLTC